MPIPLTHQTFAVSESIKAYQNPPHFLRISSSAMGRWITTSSLCALGKQGSMSQSSRRSGTAKQLGDLCGWVVVKAVKMMWKAGKPMGQLSSECLKGLLMINEEGNYTDINSYMVCIHSCPFLSTLILHLLSFWSGTD